MHSANTSNVVAGVPLAFPSPLPPPCEVVMLLDAMRDADRREEEIRTAIRGLVDRGDMLRAGDSSCSACSDPTRVTMQ
ncbi:unnamed protein product [Urochloa humidicola]